MPIITGKARKVLVAIAIVFATLVVSTGIAAPASASTLGNAVKNECIVNATLRTEWLMRDGSLRVSWLLCGQTAVSVWRITSDHTPFYIKVPGVAPFCVPAGTEFYPHNSGGVNTVLIEPTVRC